ncbi:hypothetical protein AAZX31_18G066200 [Glycine max]|uniref:Uncharacterized protein n=1 Tax=Glycine max TaxID=3847 RepID=K7MQC5_SOYBN
MECYTRPNRSDIHLSAEEEATIEAKTREYFDGVAPQRHTKPQRSDYSAQYVDAFSNAHHSSLTIPELTQFQLLQNDPQEKKLVYNGSQVPEEFVETEYYQDLNSVDKHHHTVFSSILLACILLKIFDVSRKYISALIYILVSLNLIAKY